MSDDNKPVEFSGTLSDLGDMSGVATKYPVLPTGLYRMKIKSFKMSDKPNATTGKPQKMLLLELVTTTPTTDKNLKSGEEGTVEPGHQITDRVLLTPVGDMTQTMINQKLARIMEAVLGHHEGAFNTEDLVGKEVTINLGIRPEREDKGKTYPESNEVSKYLPQD